MLGHEFRQNLVLGLDLLLQVGDPLLVGRVVGARLPAIRPFRAGEDRLPGSAVRLMFIKLRSYRPTILSRKTSVSSTTVLVLLMVCLPAVVSAA
jgi:hypothetical protein